MKQTDVTKSRRNMGKVLLLFSVAFIFLISYFVYSVTTYGQQWFSDAHNPRLSSQRANVNTGDILDRNGVKLAHSDGENRLYHESANVRRACAHVVGDNYGMTTGAESLYAQYLLGFNTNILQRVYQTVSGEPERGDDVVLTIDAQLSAYAYQLLGGNSGSIIVTNYRTGEILCEVSSPNFDPNQMEQAIEQAEAAETDSDSPGGMFVNRATMGKYPPGSVFKIVTALSAIRYRPELLEKSYHCTHEPYVVNGVQMNCYNKQSHGEVGFERAFALSCNKYFAQLAVELGNGALTQTAQSLGFNDQTLLDDFVLYSSNYSAGTSDSDLAFSAIGQFEDIVTPMHVNMITMGIANGGAIMEPRLLLEATDGRTQSYQMKIKELERPLSDYEADTLASMMIACVENGTGAAAGVAGFSVGGKTGTAEVSTDKSKDPHSWFTGFVQDEGHPIAITVVVENAGAGSARATPLAGQVLARAIELGY
ncbi:MAG: penicillin-binding transpeptidase domain-containing protein [Christensenellales bacterium]|jgi:peptidoglycan glycosyltransferase